MFRGRARLSDKAKKPKLFELKNIIQKIIVVIKSYFPMLLSYRFSRFKKTFKCFVKHFF
jgi:hypothetical protein